MKRAVLSARSYFDGINSGLQSTLPERIFLWSPEVYNPLRGSVADRLLKFTGFIIKSLKVC